jgi:putative transposase
MCRLRVDRTTAPIRLASYDYRERGAYFVTLCTYARDHLFGEVKEGQPPISDLAVLLPRIWARTVNNGRMPQPCDFVVMPNHVHGIVWLPRILPSVRWPIAVNARRAAGGDPIVGARHPPVRDGGADLECSSPSVRHVESVDASPLQRIDVTLRPLGPEPGSLGAVVSTFKSVSARAINRMRVSPGLPVWQRGYYERIVRADGELARIRRYILANPSKWPDDPNNVPV